MTKSLEEWNKTNILYPNFQPTIVLSPHPSPCNLAAHLAAINTCNKSNSHFFVVSGTVHPSWLNIQLHLLGTDSQQHLKSEGAVFLKIQKMNFEDNFFVQKFFL